jgi:hypothetical protein
MPTFTFESPEGKTYSIDGPEGATREQAFQILQSAVGGAARAPAAARPPQLRKRARAPTCSRLRTPVSAKVSQRYSACRVTLQPLLTLSLRSPSSTRSKPSPARGSSTTTYRARQALKSTIPTDFSANYNKDADYDPQTAPGRYTKAVATQLPMIATGMGAIPAAASGARWPSGLRRDRKSRS